MSNEVIKSIIKHPTAHWNQSLHKETKAYKSGSGDQQKYEHIFQFLLLLWNTKICMGDLDLLIDHLTSAKNLTSMDIIGIQYLCRIAVETMNSLRYHKLYTV